jgi:hypothetical protein
MLVDHFSKQPDDIWDWFYSFYSNLDKPEQDSFDNYFGYSSSSFGSGEDHKLIFLTFLYGLKNGVDIFEQIVNRKSTTPKIEQEITNCPGKDASERMAARFSYFHLAQSDNDVEAYAVPHLKWKSDLDWIKALIEETFGKDPFREGMIHLILHDHDLPGYENTPFKFLTADEILSVFFPKPTDKDKQEHIKEGVYYYNESVQLRIVVFQHTWNDVTEILNKECENPAVILNSLGKNADVVNEILGSSSPELDKNIYSALAVDGSVDLCRSLIKDDVGKFKFDCDNQPYYIYEDNGALLTEFMHIKTDLASSKQTVRFIDMLRNPAFNEKGELSDIRKMKFPIIIVVKPFFEDWAITVPDKSEQIETHKNKLALESNLKQVFSFFNDSSIWIRLVKNENEKNRAIQEFTYFNRIGLYGYNSAWENLEYNTRHFSGNYLIPTTGGHGRFVTPLLFGNEIKALERMKGVFESDV